MEENISHYVSDENQLKSKTETEYLEMDILRYIYRVKSSKIG